MDLALKDRVVLITGASGGIGSATARAFAAEGARTVLHGHSNRPGVEALAAELGDRALPVIADLTDEAAVTAMFERAIEHQGQVDCLIANAGVYTSADVPVHEMSLHQWQRTLDVNQTGTFLCARAFFRHLAEQRPDRASMVLVGSTAAVFGEEGHADYAAAKAAVTHGLTRTLKNEIVRLVPRGRVNCVCPGWVKTAMAQDTASDPEALTGILQTRAHARIARPEDVARTTLYLASDAASGHLTGQIIELAGGMEGRILHAATDIDPDTA